MLQGVTESNGIGWSLDGGTMYYVDSGEEVPRVRAFPFYLKTGELGVPEDFIVPSHDEGVPDGLTVDEQGCIWIAFWGGGTLKRYMPSGRLLESFAVPVTFPTCPGFGGRSLDYLYLTTAWEGLDERARQAETSAGHLLGASIGVHGRLAFRYGREGDPILST